jgi:glycosyltransferase involved in cell wall biosynthesis
MRIAYIGQKGVLPAERAGGIEKRVFEVGKRLVEMGHSVTVYARRRHMPAGQKFVEGMKIVYVPTIYTKNLEAIVYTFFSTIMALFKDYDIYHYHGVGPATLSFLPRIFKPNARVIVTFHARDQFHQKWGWFGRLYLRFGEWCSVKFPHYFIVVSHVLQVECRNEFQSQGVYIANGATIESVQRDDFLKKNHLKNKGYFLTVGRLIRVKGIHHLIKAFVRLETEMKLVIVGDGDIEYLNELKELAGDNNNVIFLGFKAGEDLKQLFAGAFSLVQPSESEGLPLTVLEAMSYGVAPLVSDIPGNMEAIFNSGFTFKSGDVYDLERVLKEMIHSPSRVSEEGEEARAIVATRFTWEVAAEHEEEVYISAFH